MNPADKASDPQWKSKYASIITTADEALKSLRPGERVFIGTACAEPRHLVSAMTRLAFNLPDTEIIQLLTMSDAPYAKKEFIDYFRINSFFISSRIRGMIQKGFGDYTPVFLSDIPRLFHSGQIPIDTALIQVSPPDEAGWCSLGISVDIVKSATDNAARVIAQVNSELPRTKGNSLIHILDIDFLVPHDEALTEWTPPKPDAVTGKIAFNVASLIENGSTLEVGIGRIPQSLLTFLTHKKNLGIHTEMITDPVVDLVKKGVVNGSHKTLDRGKVVASFCLGTKKLFNAIHNNPVYEFHPTEYVNDAHVIGKQDKMVAVNTALEVDLTGQVCADSLGPKFFSGIGGQVDFNRGAALSRQGKAIIALPSTAMKGKRSRIVNRLSSGAGVVTTRGEVHYIATEYGVAYLHGKSIQERALALISIAHPKFQGELLKGAIKLKYISADLVSKEGILLVDQKETRTSYLTEEGEWIQFRSIRPTDETGMRHLFNRLSDQTKYYRFMSAVKHVPRHQIQDFVFIDHRKDVAIVGAIQDASGEKILAIGRYYLDEKENLAEVAFVVDDHWQNKGIGTFLLKHLIKIARNNGIRGFTAEVLVSNRAMQSVINKSKCRISTSIEDEIVSYKMIFND